MLVELRITNLKGVEYALWRPTKGVNRIGGLNGSGKTSATDAFIWLLRGAKAGVQEPVRIGAEKAEVVADLNGYTITRSKKPGGQDILKVETKEGARMPSPQDFLNKMLGEIGFDPGKFMLADAAKQRKMILEAFQPTVSAEEFIRKTGYKRPDGSNFTVLGLDGIAAIVKDQEGGRTKIGHKKRDLEGKLKGFPDDILTYPDEERDVMELEDRRKTAEQMRDDIKTATTDKEHWDGRILAMDQKIEQCKKEIAEAEHGLAGYAKEVDRAEKKLESLPQPEEFDFKAEVDAMQAHNGRVELKRAYAATKKQIAHWDNQYEDATEQIKKMRECRAGLVQQIDLGVEGLAISDDAITLNGVPVKDLSTAEALKMGILVAMKQNPKIKIIRIRNGAELDHQNLQLLADWVEENGFQAFVETVSEKPEDGAIFMHEGRIPDEAERKKLVDEWLEKNGQEKPEAK